MTSDPRFSTYWEELDPHNSTVAVDGTINLPTIGVGGIVPSTSLKLLVALVNAGAAAPQAGLGSSGNEVFGKIKQVNTDGMATVQDRGYMAVTNNGAAPAVGAPVGVDGAGKAISAAGNKQAFFCGTVVDPATGNNLWLIRKI